MKPLARTDMERTPGDDVDVLRRMVRFAEEAEQAPLALLLESMPALAEESSQKLEIAARVMEQKLAGLSSADRDAIIELGKEIIQRSDEDLARRLRIILS